MQMKIQWIKDMPAGLTDCLTDSETSLERGIRQVNKKTSIMDSMKMKLIFITAGVCIIPLLIATLLSYVNLKNVAQDDAKELNLRLAEKVSQDIELTIDSSFRTMVQMADTPSVRELIADPSNEALLNEVVKELQTLVTNAGDGNSTVVTGADGMNVARSTGNFVDISEREYFKQAMQGNTYLSELSVSKTTGARIIVPAVPVFAEDGKTPIGALTRNYDVDYLHDKLVADAGTGQIMFIMDGTGQVIATSEQEITAEDDISRAGTEVYSESLTAVEGSFVESFNGNKYVTSFVKEAQTGWTIVVSTEYAVIMSNANKAVVILVIIGIVLAAIAVVIAFMIGNAIDRPIDKIDEALEHLADGRFTDIEVYLDRRDEFGNMIRNVNSVIDKLRDIVANVRVTANDLEEDAVELTDSARKISNNMSGISEAVHEIASGATQQAEEIQNASINCQVISDNVESVTADAGSLASTAEIMSQGSQSSQDKLRDLQHSSEQMAGAINQITETIAATGTAVDKISSKIEAIDSIASQTSLLALNASIEAARAGEAGRGFAVVAEEIGKLASDSANSANEIRIEMSNLLTQSQEAVRVADDVSKANKEQYTIIEDTVEAIQSLIDGINTTVSGVQNINMSADACDQSKEVVVDAMNNLSAISQENAASTEETSASVAEIDNTLSELAHETSSLKEHADTLMSEMEFFQI